MLISEMVLEYYLGKYKRKFNEYYLILYLEDKTDKEMIQEIKTFLKTGIPQKEFEYEPDCDY